MDFSKGNWDILGMIMEMKDKAEYEDKVEKSARKNFELVLNHIKSAGSFDFEGVDSDRIHFTEKDNLDKSKLFFIGKKGRKYYPDKITENEEFIELMNDYYKDYLEGALTPLLSHTWDYDIPEWREYPNGLSLEQYTEHYIWDNGIHYTIRWSNLDSIYYCDYKYQQERCKEVLQMADYLYNPLNRRDREIHERLFVAYSEPNGLKYQIQTLRRLRLTSKGSGEELKNVKRQVKYINRATKDYNQACAYEEEHDEPIWIEDGDENFAHDAADGIP